MRKLVCAGETSGLEEYSKYSFLQPYFNHLDTFQRCLVEILAPIFLPNFRCIIVHFSTNKLLVFSLARSQVELDIFSLSKYFC